MFCFPGPSGFICVGAAILQNVVEPTVQGLKWVTTTDLKLIHRRRDSFGIDWTDYAQLLCEYITSKVPKIESIVMNKLAVKAVQIDM